MTDAKIIELIQGGENIQVEFKKSTNDITKDVYDTVCSFSNRDGGTILLGVDDNKNIIGINPEKVDQIKKDFVTSINNPEKFYPPLFIEIKEHLLNGKIILVIEVPVCNQVCRHKGRIYDRLNDSDIDITNYSDRVYQAYARKSSSYFVNKVTSFQLEDLRHDLFDRARQMAMLKTKNHPWETLSDMEILKSCGLYLRNDETGKEGVTIAGVLLFGNDITIMAALPQHKSDALLRIENLDRYDDREVIITNLFESYDRLMAFGQKHLSDPFVLEGIQSISARDKILREILSNSLAHRDYASGYVAKFVIENGRFFTENANRSNGHGTLNLSFFKPVSKNPAISKFFREVGLADELGSGMRNTFKYTKLYSGGDPQFIEGDIFTIIIPLSFANIGKVGPSINVTPQVAPPKSYPTSHTPQVASKKDAFKNQVLINQILEFCKVPRFKREIAEHFDFKDIKYFTNAYLKPLLKENRLKMTISEKPNSRFQKYISC